MPSFNSGMSLHQVEIVTGTFPHFSKEEAHAFCANHNFDSDEINDAIDNMIAGWSNLSVFAPSILSSNPMQMFLFLVASDARHIDENEWQEIPSRKACSFMCDDNFFFVDKFLWRIYQYDSFYFRGVLSNGISPRPCRLSQS
jgi:hypothetical protein